MENTDLRALGDMKQIGQFMFRAGDGKHMFGTGDRVGYILRGKTKTSTKAEIWQHFHVRKMVV